MKLIHNSVKCKRCGDIIESKSHYDYKQCTCGFVAVDGGNLAPRIIGEPQDYEVLYQWATVDNGNNFTLGTNNDK